MVSIYTCDNGSVPGASRRCSRAISAPTARLAADFRELFLAAGIDQFARQQLCGEQAAAVHADLGLGWRPFPPLKRLDRRRRLVHGDPADTAAAFLVPANFAEQRLEQLQAALPIAVLSADRNGRQTRSGTAPTGHLIIVVGHAVHAVGVGRPEGTPSGVPYNGMTEGTDDLNTRHAAEGLSLVGVRVHNLIA